MCLYTSSGRCVFHSVSFKYTFNESKCKYDVAKIHVTSKKKYFRYALQNKTSTMKTKI